MRIRMKQAFSNKLEQTRRLLIEVMSSLAYTAV